MTMDATTLAALDASIKHWQENVEALTPDQASVEADDCALCRRFNSGIYSGCPRCPVEVATDWPLCRRTPYGETAPALRHWKGTEDALFSEDDYAKAKAQWRVAAKAELDFLKAIRPIGLSPSQGDDEPQRSEPEAQGR